MRLSVLSGKLLLAVGSLAVGLTIYLLSPSARMVPLGYWTAIVVYILALETAWHLAELQTSRRPRLFSRAGLQELPRKAFKITSAPESSSLVRQDPLVEVGLSRDVERDVTPTLLSSLTTVGSDNRFELIVAPPGAGKSTLLYRLASELLERGYRVATLSGKLPEAGVDGHALRSLSRQARRLFILIDDVEMQPATGSLLALVLGRNDGMTVLGSCSQQAYDAILRGSGSRGMGARDLASLGTPHQLRLTPRDSQALYDRVVGRHPPGSEVAIRARQIIGGATEPLSLSVGLEHGCIPATLALAAVDDLQPSHKAVAYGLLVLAMGCGGVAQAHLKRVFGAGLSESLDAMAATGLVLVHSDHVRLPHPAIALTLLRAQGWLEDEQRLDIAEQIVRGLFDEDMLRGNAVMRGLLYSEPALGAQLWARCRDLWIGAADDGTAAETIELVVPTLCLAGDHRLAADLCRDHLGHPALGDRAAFQLGLCMHQSGSHRAAADMFAGFLSHESYARIAQLNWALAAIGHGRYQEAEEVLDSLEQGHPGLPGLHHLLGYVAELKGELTTAMEKYREARAHYWFDNVALRRLAALKIATGASQDAIRLFEAGLQQESGNVDHYGGLAVAHYLDGNTGRAAVQSSRAINAGVEPAVARKGVARAYIEYSLYDQALMELNNCLAYRPDDVEAHVMIGQCLHSQNDLDGARQTLQDALTIAPGSVVARQHLASCLLDLGQHEEAAALISQTSSEQTPTAELALLSAMIAANQGDMQRCAQQAAMALEAGDESGWAWFISARATGGGQAADSYEKSVTLLAQTAVTASRVASASAYQALAVCRRELGDPNGAAQAARSARNRIMHEQYGGEPVLSALIFRHIPAAQFLQELFGLDEGGS